MGIFYNGLIGTSSRTFQLGKDRVIFSNEDPNLLQFKFENGTKIFTINVNENKLILPNGGTFSMDRSNEIISMHLGENRLIFDLINRQIKIAGDDIDLTFDIDAIYAEIETKLSKSSAAKTVYGVDAAGNQKQYSLENGEIGNVYYAPNSTDYEKSMRVSQTGTFELYRNIPQGKIYYVRYDSQSLIENGSKEHPYKSFSKLILEKGSEVNVNVFIFPGYGDYILNNSIPSSWTISGETSHSGEGSRVAIKSFNISNSSGSNYRSGFSVKEESNDSSAGQTYYEKISFLDNLNLSGGPKNIINSSFADNISSSSNKLLLKDCEFLTQSVILNSGNLILNGNRNVSLIQTSGSTVIEGNDTFIVPTVGNYAINITGGTFKAYGGRVLKQDGTLAPIYIGEDVTYSIDDLTFDVESSVLLGTKLHEGKKTNQIEDINEYNNIYPVGRTQRDVNRAVDSAIGQLLGNAAHDRGFVINAFNGENIQRIASVSIVSGGTDYQVGDLLFLQSPVQQDQIIKAVFNVSNVNLGVITGISVVNSGSYTDINTSLTFATTTNGSGSGATFTISKVSAPASTTSSILNPQPGDKVVVLRDETNGFIKFNYSYADLSGNGNYTWIPVDAASSVELIGDNTTIQVNDGIISVANNTFALKNDTVNVVGNQNISGQKTFNISPIVPSKSTLPLQTNTTVLATESQVHSARTYALDQATQLSATAKSEAIVTANAYTDTKNANLQEKPENGKTFVKQTTSTGRLDVPIKSIDVEYDGTRSVEQAISQLESINDVSNAIIISSINVQQSIPTLVSNKLEQMLNVFDLNSKTKLNYITVRYRLSASHVTNDNMLSGTQDVDYFVRLTASATQTQSNGNVHISLRGASSDFDFKITAIKNSSGVYSSWNTLVVRRLSLELERRIDISSQVIDYATTLSSFGSSILTAMNSYADRRFYILYTNEASIPFMSIFGSTVDNNASDHRRVIILFDTDQTNSHIGNATAILLNTSDLNPSIYNIISKVNMTFDRSAADLNLKVDSIRTISDNEFASSVVLGYVPTQWQGSYLAKNGDTNGFSIAKIKSGETSKSILTRGNTSDDRINIKTIDGQSLLGTENIPFPVAEHKRITNSIVFPESGRITLGSLYNQIVALNQPFVYFEMTAEKTPLEMMIDLAASASIRTYVMDRVSTGDTTKFITRIYSLGFEAHSPTTANIANESTPRQTHKLIGTGIFEKSANSTDAYAEDLYDFVCDWNFGFIKNQTNSTILTNKETIGNINAGQKHDYLEIKKIKSGSNTSAILEKKNITSNEDEYDNVAINLKTYNGESLLGTGDIGKLYIPNVTGLISWSTNILSFASSLIAITTNEPIFITNNLESAYPAILRTQASNTDMIPKVWTKVGVNEYIVSCGAYGIHPSAASSFFVHLDLSSQSNNVVRPVTGINLSDNGSIEYQTITVGGSNVFGSGSSNNALYLTKIASGTEQKNIAYKTPAAAANNYLNIATINGESLIGNKNIQVLSEIIGTNVVSAIHNMQNQYNSGNISEGFKISSFIEEDL